MIRGEACVRFEFLRVTGCGKLLEKRVKAYCEASR